jgi:L-methionine (R)-S-oxide reductase
MFLHELNGDSPMHTVEATNHLSKPEAYRSLAAQLEGLLVGEVDPVANAANTAALIYHGLPDLNWAGFYFLKNGELVLGPFQGRPACVRIAVGRGVCGTAVAQGETILVPDVEQFPGHIACDAASRSELVVPLRIGNRTIGVLDLDSPMVERFDAEDRAGCEALARIFLEALNGNPAAQTTLTSA